VLADGSWEQDVADRLTDRAGDAWERLKRNRRKRKRNCKRLAQMARTILMAQDQIHRLAEELASQAASVVGVRGPALDFTRELVKRILIGSEDVKLTAAARTIQIAGIVLCLMNGLDLTRCDCFIDLALAETKERVSQILEMRLTNWAELTRFGENPSCPAFPRVARDRAGARGGPAGPWHPGQQVPGADISLLLGGPVPPLVSATVFGSAATI
jgi:hypothetical protein